MRRRIVMLVLLLGVLGGGLWWGLRTFGPPSALEASEKASPWQTEPVRRGDLQPEVAAMGTVTAAKTVVLTWQASGTVAEIPALGTRVSQGQVVARLDPNSWSHALLTAQAQLAELRHKLQQLQTVGEAQAWNQYAEARFQEERAKDNLESIYDKIADGEAISEITLQRYESAYALAKAQREHAERVYQAWKEGRAPEMLTLQAQMRALEAQLATAELTAPFTGTVTWVYSPEGTVVGPGTRALRLDDLSRLYVDMELNELDVVQTRVGQMVRLTFDGLPYTTFQGLVVEIAPVGTQEEGLVAQSTVVKFRVRALMKDPDERIRPGMSAAAVILGDKVEDVLLVPSRAIRVVGGQPTVYVLRNGAPTPVAVKLGLSSGAYTQIVEGELEEGDLVVLNPPTFSFFGE